MSWRAGVSVELARLAERVAGLDRLTDEKFVRLGDVMAAQAATVALAHDASDKAIAKAEASVNERLAAMNEFRGSLADQASGFIPRTEAEQRIAAVVERIEAQREQVAIGDAKLDERLKALEQGSSNLQGRFWALGLGLGAVVVLVNIAIAMLTR